MRSIVSLSRLASPYLRFRAVQAPTVFATQVLRGYSQKKENDHFKDKNQDKALQRVKPAKKQVDFFKILDVEIKNTKEDQDMSLNSEDCQRFLKETKFSISENKETGDITMKKLIHNGELEVLVRWHPNSYLNENLSSDVPSSDYDNQEEQGEEKTDDDHISTEPEEPEEDPEEDREGQEDFNIDEEATSEPPFRIMLKKPSQSEEEAVCFNCSSEQSRLTIDTLSRPPPTNHTIREHYIEFADLAQVTQDKLLDFFEEIGIDDQFAQFVKDYSIRAKSQKKKKSKFFKIYKNY